MITKNGAIIYSAQCGYNAGTESRVLTKINGSSSAPNYSTSGLELSGVMQKNMSSGGTCIQLGVGDAEPTKNDYYLNETIVDGVNVNNAIPCISAVKSISADGNIVYTAIFSNNSSVAYTIKEIGLIQTMYDGNTHYLTARKLIPPRTIQPGETATFSYVIAFN